MSRIVNIMRVSLAGLFLVVLASCAATFDDHGYVPTDGELAQIHIGDSRDKVSTTIGHPTIEGMQSASDWYYVQSRWRYYGPLKPKEVDRQVVAITFTPKGTVQNIERFGLEKGNVVAISRRVTTSTVKSLGLLQQLFSDVGHFNPGALFNSNH